MPRSGSGSPGAGRVALAVVAATAVAAGAATVPFALRPPPVAVSSSAYPTMPAGLDTVRPWVAHARRSPPGTSIALVDATVAFRRHYLAVGAHTNRIRSVLQFPASADGGPPYPARLSPDGRQLAFGRRAAASRSGVVLVDLTMGTSREFPTAGDAEVLAWSPDSRLLAYVDDHTDLALLDTRNGRRRLVDAGAPALPEESPHPHRPGAVAFSPDGTRLAVDVGEAVRLIPLAGGTGATVAKRVGQVLAGPAAWSPDGRLIALYHEAPFHRQFPDFLNAVLSFVPVGAPDGPDWTSLPAFETTVMGEVSIDLLGWMAPSEPVVAQLGADNARVFVHGGDGRTLMRLGADADGVQLATGLLDDAEARGSRHDTGPTPVWVLPSLSTASALAAFGACGFFTTVATLLAIRRRRRADEITDRPELPRRAAVPD